MCGSADVSPSPSSLIALKPRQVLLSEQQQRSRAASTPMAKNKPENAAQLKPEDESTLSFSVALWLENKGFSKVLKRFLSAAQIQDDNWKAKALNLNEVFSKYQEMCSSAHKDLKSQKKQEEQVVATTDKIVDANGTKSEEIQSKKKKKSKGDIAVKDTEKKIKDVAMSEKMNKSFVNGNEDQSHKASGLGHKDQDTKASEESNGDQIHELSEDQPSKKQKEKKKKKSKLTDAVEKKMDAEPEVTELSKSSAAELIEREITVDKKSKRGSSEGAEDDVNESKKASKKRKRMASDENDNQSGQEVAVEESKSKKSKGMEEKTALPVANGHASEQDKGETFEAGQAGSGIFSAKLSDETNKTSMNNGMDKSNQQKSANRQPKSSEPKTVKAFQRVKIDEVEFVDERLQDNSYWAKDGADSGYGAKAQEVLGQVKGRDFRHEKTKKKRGSYRGGQIDLHSHSIKFKDSDEE